MSINTPSVLFLNIDTVMPYTKVCAEFNTFSTGLMASINKNIQQSFLGLTLPKLFTLPTFYK